MSVERHLLRPTQGRVGERGVLTRRRMVNSFFERVFRHPLFGWARCAIPIHFVEPPEDFNATEGAGPRAARLKRSFRFVGPNVNRPD